MFHCLLSIFIKLGIAAKKNWHTICLNQSIVKKIYQQQRKNR